MELYKIDKKYLEYTYKNVDSEVLFSHVDDDVLGRANVLVMRTEYKGQYLDFAIPQKGEIKPQMQKDSVLLKQFKRQSKLPKGFVIQKLMPIDISVVSDFLVLDEDFVKIRNEISGKEPELIAKTKAHLKKLEEGKTGKFSTNVDKQLQFLNARAELLNQGYSEEEIYGESFAMNVKKAEVLKKTDLGAERIKSKGMELKL